jgi:hypothetical protein
MSEILLLLRVVMKAYEYFSSILQLFDLDL